MDSELTRRNWLRAHGLPTIAHGIVNGSVHAGSVRKPRTEGGTWSYRLDLGFDDVGKRRQREVGGFRTKKGAQAALDGALSGVQRGMFVAPSRTTVSEFLELWLDGVKTEMALTASVSYRQGFGVTSIRTSDRSVWASCQRST